MSDYVDFAEYYDFDHALTDDIDFYRQYARQCGSPILELGCGTGRLTLPVAQTGAEVHGVDISVNMLQVCQKAVQTQGLAERVHLIQADMAEFELPRKGFALAFAGLRSFMHLLTRSRQRACVKCVHRHLRLGGLFIVDVIAPDLQKLAQEPDEVYAVQREFLLPDGNRVVRKSRLLQHDRRRQVRYFEFLFEEYHADGALVRRRRVPVATRYLGREEMQRLFTEAGFAVVDVFRDFEKQPYDGSGEMIVVARRVE